MKIIHTIDILILAQVFIKIIPIYKEGALLGSWNITTPSVNEFKDDRQQQTGLKSHHITWFLISDHWENQHSDSVDPCIYYFIGNQDKNGPLGLVIMQQILKFTA